MSIIRFFKKLLDSRKCRFLIAMVTFADKIDVYTAFDKIDGEKITEKSLKELLNAEDVKIIKSCIVSRKCAFEMMNSMETDNVYYDLLNKATSITA
jgi:hypothetical protein